MAEKTIKIKGLGIHEVDDLDFVLFENFMPEYGDEGSNINKVHENVSYNLIPISVDSIIEIAKKFKEIGASHIGVYQHTDHQGYVFEGYDVHEVDNKEYVDKSQSEIDKTINDINLNIDKLVELKDKLSDNNLSIDSKKMLINNFK